MAKSDTLVILGVLGLGAVVLASRKAEAAAPAPVPGSTKPAGTSVPADCISQAAHGIANNLDKYDPAILKGMQDDLRTGGEWGPGSEGAALCVGLVRQGQSSLNCRHLIIEPLKTQLRFLNSKELLIVVELSEGILDESILQCLRERAEQVE